MYLSGFKQDPYLMIKPDSDLYNISPEFLQNKYVVRLSGEFNNDFIEKFVTIFRDVKHLDLGMQYGIVNSFVYDLPNLEGLVFPLYRDVDFILDGSMLPKSLKQLHIYVYTKNKLKNLDALNDSLERLTISDFDEKDLTKLDSLTNLKSLSFLTARIKTLKGIESMKNLRVLSLGGIRSLIDISDITTLQNLKFLEFDICWKLQDFSPIGQLKELEVLQLMDCKNLASIKFVKEMPKLRQLYTLGSTIINDYDTTPAVNVPIYFGSMASNKYNKSYPEKEIIEGQKTESNYL